MLTWLLSFPSTTKFTSCLFWSSWNHGIVGSILSITMKYLRITVISNCLCYKKCIVRELSIIHFQKGNIYLVLWKANTTLSDMVYWLLLPAARAKLVVFTAVCFLGQQSSMYSHHSNPHEVATVPRGSGSCGCENLANHHWHRWKRDFSKAAEGARTFTTWDFLDSHAKHITHFYVITYSIC
jgi:hypothetical protein